MNTQDVWWNAIDPRLLARIDGLLRTHRLVQAVVLLRKEWERRPRPGLYEAQDLLNEGRDMPLSDGTVPPWPEAQQAIAQGRAVAQHLGVPFHFAGPHERDDDLPRWWDTRPD